MADNVKYVNEKLKSMYGTDSSGNVIFRVVWSTTQREKRRSSYTEAGIYLGNFLTQVRDLPKYPYVRDRWVLEMFLPTHGNPELLTKTTYEPIYVFQDKDQNPLPLLLKVCIYVIKRLAEVSKTTPQLEKAADESKMEAEIRQNYMELEEAGHSTIGSHLATRTGIIVPESYSKE